MAKVSDLFELEYGHSLELNRLVKSDSPDAINFVSRTARNNGVSARIEPIVGLQPAASGTISVALGGQGGAGEAFAQPYPYYCGRDVMVLKPKKNMTEAEQLYWASCISANRFRFGFGRQANRTLKDLILPDALPRWVAQVNVDQFVNAGRAAKPDRSISLPERLSWPKFKLDELFDLRKGKRLNKSAMTIGSTPFISAIDKNNGVSAFIGQDPIHEANTLTVNYDGGVGIAFYQPEAFWCADSVNVLYPKFPLTPAIGLFLITIIQMERYRFNYGRKWHLERMKTSHVRLPARPDGRPDWKYMQSFIESLPLSSQISR